MAANLPPEDADETFEQNDDFHMNLDDDLIITQQQPPDYVSPAAGPSRAIQIQEGDSVAQFYNGSLVRSDEDKMLMTAAQLAAHVDMTAIFKHDTVKQNRQSRVCTNVMSVVLQHNRDLRDHHQEVIEKHDQLTQELANLGAQFAKVWAERDELQLSNLHESNALEQQTLAKLKMNDTIQIEKEKFEAKVKELEKETRSLARENQRLSKRFRNSENRIKELEAENNLLKLRVKELEDAYTHLCAPCKIKTSQTVNVKTQQSQPLGVETSTLTDDEEEVDDNKSNKKKKAKKQNKVTAAKKKLNDEVETAFSAEATTPSDVNEHSSFGQYILPHDNIPSFHLTTVDRLLKDTAMASTPRVTIELEQKHSVNISDDLQLSSSSDEEEEPVKIDPVIIFEDELKDLQSTPAPEPNLTDYEDEELSNCLFQYPLPHVDSAQIPEGVPSDDSSSEEGRICIASTDTGIRKNDYHLEEEKNQEKMQKAVEDEKKEQEKLQKALEDEKKEQEKLQKALEDEKKEQEKLQKALEDEKKDQEKIQKALEEEKKDQEKLQEAVAKEEAENQDKMQKTDEEVEKIEEESTKEILSPIRSAKERASSDLLEIKSVTSSSKFCQKKQNEIQASGLNKKRLPTTPVKDTSSVIEKRQRSTPSSDTNSKKRIRICSSSSEGEISEAESDEGSQPIEDMNFTKVLSPDPDAGTYQTTSKKERVAHQPTAIVENAVKTLNIKKEEIRVKDTAATNALRSDAGANVNKPKRRQLRKKSARTRKRKSTWNANQRKLIQLSKELESESNNESKGEIQQQPKKFKPSSKNPMVANSPRKSNRLRSRSLANNTASNDTSSSLLTEPLANTQSYPSSLLNEPLANTQSDPSSLLTEPIQNAKKQAGPTKPIKNVSKQRNPSSLLTKPIQNVSTPGPSSLLTEPLQNVNQQGIEIDSSKPATVKDIQDIIQMIRSEMMAEISQQVRLHLNVGKEIVMPGDRNILSPISQTTTEASPTNRIDSTLSNASNMPSTEANLSGVSDSENDYDYNESPASPPASRSTADIYSQPMGMDAYDEPLDPKMREAIRKWRDPEFEMNPEFIKSSLEVLILRGSVESIPNDIPNFVGKLQKAGFGDYDLAAAIVMFLTIIRPRAPKVQTPDGLLLERDYKLLVVVQSLVEDYRDSNNHQTFRDLPELIIEFGSEMFRDTKIGLQFDADRERLGRFYGALGYKLDKQSKFVDLIFSTMYWRPQQAYAFIFGLICNYPNIFNVMQLGFSTGSHIEQAIVFCFWNPPSHVSDARFHHVLKEHLKNLNITNGIPDLTFEEYMSDCWNKMQKYESDTSIRNASRILSLLCIQAGWERFETFVKNNTAKLVTSWRNQEISDAVCSAYIAMIGRVSVDSREHRPLTQLFNCVKPLATKQLNAHCSDVMKSTIQTCLVNLEKKKRVLSTPEHVFHFSKKWIPHQKQGKKTGLSNVKDHPIKKRKKKRSIISQQHKRRGKLIAQQIRLNVLKK